MCHMMSMIVGSNYYIWMQCYESSVYLPMWLLVLLLRLRYSGIGGWQQWNAEKVIPCWENNWERKWNVWKLYVSLLIVHNKHVKSDTILMFRDGFFTASGLQNDSRWKYCYSARYINGDINWHCPTPWKTMPWHKEKRSSGGTERRVGPITSWSFSQHVGPYDYSWYDMEYKDVENCILDIAKSKLWESYPGRRYVEERNMVVDRPDTRRNNSWETSFQ